MKRRKFREDSACGLNPAPGLPVSLLMARVAGLGHWLSANSPKRGSFRAKREWAHHVAIGSCFMTLALFALLNLMCCGRCAAEEGVFILRESASHSEATARAARYVSCRTVGEITILMTPEGRQVRITKFQPLETLPDINLYKYEKIGAADAAAFAEALARYRSAYNKYPNARPLLKPQVDTLDQIVSQLNSGKVWLDRRWTDPADVEKARLAAEAKRKNDQAQQAGQLRKKLLTQLQELQRADEKAP